MLQSILKLNYKIKYFKLPQATTVFDLICHIQNMYLQILIAESVSFWQEALSDHSCCQSTALLLIPSNCVCAVSDTEQPARMASQIMAFHATFWLLNSYGANVGLWHSLLLCINIDPKLLLFLNHCKASSCVAATVQLSSSPQAEHPRQRPFQPANHYCQLGESQRTWYQ